MVLQQWLLPRPLQVAHHHVVAVLACRWLTWLTLQSDFCLDPSPVRTMSRVSCPHIHTHTLSLSRSPSLSLCASWSLESPHHCTVLSMSMFLLFPQSVDVSCVSPLTLAHRTFHHPPSLVNVSSGSAEGVDTKPQQQSPHLRVPTARSGMAQIGEDDDARCGHTLGVCRNWAIPFVKWLVFRVSLTHCACVYVCGCGVCRSPAVSPVLAAPDADISQVLSPPPAWRGLHV